MDVEVTCALLCPFTLEYCSPLSWNVNVMLPSFNSNQVNAHQWNLTTTGSELSLHNAPTWTLEGCHIRGWWQLVFCTKVSEITCNYCGGSVLKRTNFEKRTNHIHPRNEHFYLWNESLLRYASKEAIKMVIFKTCLFQ